MLKDQLKKARKAAGLTQKAVADHLGITESTYCGYETGKRQPDAIKIGQIASFLGVTGDYLLEINTKENEHIAERAPILCEKREEIYLIACFRSLNSDGQAAAIAAVEGLANTYAFQEDAHASKMA